MKQTQVRAAVWRHLRQGTTIGTAYTLAARELSLDDRLVVTAWLKMHNRWLRYVLKHKYGWAIDNYTDN